MITTRTNNRPKQAKALTLSEKKRRFAALAGAFGHDRLAPWKYFTDKRIKRAIDRLLTVEADATQHGVHFLLSVWDPQMPKATPRGEFRLHEALRAWDRYPGKKAAFLAWAARPWWGHPVLIIGAARHSHFHEFAPSLADRLTDEGTWWDMFTTAWLRRSARYAEGMGIPFVHSLVMGSESWHTFLSRTGMAPSAQLYAFLFIMDIWTRGTPTYYQPRYFPLAAALSLWNETQRAVFLAWARAPWWFGLDPFPNPKIPDAPFGGLPVLLKPASENGGKPVFGPCRPGPRPYSQYQRRVRQGRCPRLRLPFPSEWRLFDALAGIMGWPGLEPWEIERDEASRQSFFEAFQLSWGARRDAARFLISLWNPDHRLHAIGPFIVHEALFHWTADPAKLRAFLVWAASPWWGDPIPGNPGPDPPSKPIAWPDAGTLARRVGPHTAARYTRLNGLAKSMGTVFIHPDIHGKKRFISLMRQARYDRTGRFYVWQFLLTMLDHYFLVPYGMGIFDIHEALPYWDEKRCMAFLAWVNKPWWV